MTQISSPLGIATRDAQGTRLEYVRRYPDAVEHIWAAITEPDRLQRWIGTYDGTPRVGGTVDFTMTAEGDDVPPEAVTILECDPPKRLVVDWAIPDQTRWQVEVTLTPTADGGTELIFVHLMASSEGAGDIGPGWQFYLDRLQASLEGSALPEFDGYLEQLGDHYRLDG